MNRELSLDMESTSTRPEANGSLYESLIFPAEWKSE